MKKVLLFLLPILIITGTLFLYPRHTHTFSEEVPLGRDERGFTYIKMCTECGHSETVIYDALLTFVDDDGKTQAMVHWSNIIDKTGIKMTAALIPSKIEKTTDYDTWWSYAGWDLLEQMQQKGVDFVHHTFSHQNLTALTEEEIHIDLQHSRDSFKALGIESRILVYPNNATNSLVESVVDDYFDVAVALRNKNNTESFSTNYCLYRMNSNDSSRIRTIEFPDGRVADCQGLKSQALMTSELDNAIAEKGWLVYMTHAYDSPAGQFYFDEESEQTIIDFCTYVQGLENVKIVTLTEGVAASADLQAQLGIN